MNASSSFSGRCAIVTGATGGMGAAISRRFVEAGADVVATDLHDAAGAELVASCGDLPGSMTFVAADVADATAVAAVVASAVERYSRLDCAVNAAAIELETVPLADCADEDFDRIMAVNVRGIFLSMKHELRAMVAAGNGGAIVNIASTNSFRPQHDQPAYTASKHAVLGLTRSAAMDYAAHDIRVNAICPGAIDTPMLRAAMERRNRDADAVAKRLSNFGRFGRPEEIADAALWLCSEGSTFTTGHALAVDGGMLSS
jgi:NAD(P)-dependent dehydrogenase (short-subunit alcohol dehydrogenase family)